MRLFYTVSEAAANPSTLSMCAIVCVAYLSVILAVRFPWDEGVCELGDEEAGGTYEEYKFSTGLCTSLPIFCFAFNCQVQFIPIVKELEDASKGRVGKLVAVTMCAVCVLYCVDATMGYLSFCESTESNILDNYSGDDKLVLVGRACFVGTLCFSFPLYSTAIVTSVERLMGGGGEGKGGRREGIAAGVILSMVGIVYGDPPLDKVLGLTGAVGGCALVYVFPGLFYDRAVEGGSWGGRVLAAAGGLLGVTCTVVILLT